MRYLRDVLSDGQVAIRALGKQKLFAAMAILSMTIGIGANTAIFTVANALLFRGPAGVTDTDRLVDIGAGREDGGLNPTSFPSYVAVRDRAQSFAGVYARQMFLRALTVGTGNTGTPERGYADFVTLNYFTVLGLRPAVGRLFVASDSEAVGASPIAVVSHAYWRNRLNRSPAAVGQTIRLNGRPFTIVGVAPDGFQGTGVTAADVWVPITTRPAITDESAAVFENARAAWLMIGARLKPGVSFERGASEVAAIGHALQQGETATPARALRAVPSSLFPGNRGIVAGFMTLLMGMISLVLVVACVNVSGILIAKGITRHREMAVRLSLGATRARLVRQLLAETAAISLLGAAGGLLLARVLVALSAAWLGTMPFPIVISLGIDARVTAYTAGLSLVAAFITGLLPALRTSNAQPNAAIKGDETGPLAGTRLRRLMVVGQVALSMMLVVLAGLFARALAQAGAVNPGFETRGVELTTIDLSAGRYTRTTGAVFLRELLDRVRELPGIEHATISQVVPGGFEGLGLGLGVPGKNDDFEADGNIVEPGYFATLGIPIIAGRDFDASDRADGRRVVIVGEQAARHYWPGEDALGKYMTEAYGPDAQTHSYEVIGVVGDVKSTSLIDGMSQSFVYVPLRQMFLDSMLLVTRSRSTASVAPDVRRIIVSMDPNLLVAPSSTLAESVAFGFVLQRVAASIAGSLGTFGLCLAAVGLYAVTSLTIVRRFREFGIRLALGAPRRQILGLILRQGLGLVLVGCAIGAAPAVAAAYVFAGFLLGLPALDPTVIGAAAVLFLAVGCLACIGPALRATSVSPLSVLRGN
jgi:predicted permease